MSEEHALFAARIKKLETLREKGVNPYANDFKPGNTTKEIHDKYGDLDAEELEKLDETHSIAGRIMALRSFGKAAFIVVSDRTGKLQAFVQKKRIGNEAFDIFKIFDVGDIVGIVGAPVRTRTGELTLNASEIRLLTKNLRPLPEKWHGLTDTETRFRQRHIDLAVNPKVVEIFKTRTEIIRKIRAFLDARDFLEVETPMLHPVLGGAVARPFVTHHNTLNADFYLRIAPELYLKRLLVGGLERVYEINRNFRNEGISTRHNPEFTMIEFYLAYATYNDLMDLTEEMIGGIVQDLFGSYEVPYQGRTLDFSPPWERLSIIDAIVKYGEDIKPEELSTREGLLAVARRIGIKDTEGVSDGKLTAKIFETVAEEKCIQPTFILDLPLDISPLSRRKESDPTLADRFELFIAGREIANAFSELNDPVDQKGRFEEQVRAREAGDKEAGEMDDDYLCALEAGMPPAAGEGIGIDRLCMILTDSYSIREVILFPQLRREQ